MTQKFTTVSALLICILLSTGCHPPTRNNNYKIKHYISPSADFKHYSRFTLIPYSVINKASKTDSFRESRTLFELQNLLEEHGFQRVRPDEFPDFYATAYSDAIPNYMFRPSDHSIESTPPLVIDVNLLKSLEWTWKPYGLKDSEAPTGQEYFQSSQQISVLAFKGDTKENLFYGILNPGYSSTTTPAGMVRHFEMSVILSQNFPESSEGGSYYKPGMIGLNIRILTENGISYYPHVLKNPIHNSPAEKAGFQISDVIITVNGTSTLNKSYAEVVQMIRGEPGTKVGLDVLRGDKLLHFDLIRVLTFSPE